MYYLYADCVCVNQSTFSTVQPVCLECEGRRVKFVQSYDYDEYIKNCVKSDLRYEVENNGSAFKRALEDHTQEQIDKIDWNAKVKEGLLALLQNDEELTKVMKEGLD